MRAKENRSQQTLQLEKFSLEDLKRFTERFSTERIIGEGGFGTVYKGEKDNGEFIAVKKLNETVAQIDHMQLQEVLNVMHISHPNIVRLEGYCINKEWEIIEHNGKIVIGEKPCRLICFEYLPGGNLKAYLDDKYRVPNWNERYNIIKGICMGLHYLHEGRGGKYILHLDLKPANVLLDENMMPKIADFGQSRLWLLNEGQTQTTKPVGTIGYMPPEYIRDGKLSKKTDVYSLGVIIMEIIAGKRKYPDEQLDEVREKWKETSAFGREEHDQIKKCIKLALDCMEEEPRNRLNMKEVIEILGISEDDDMNHHPDEIEEHSVINIESREVEPLLLQGHRRHTMTADKKGSTPKILERTAVTIRTQWRRMRNTSVFGVPLSIVFVSLFTVYALMLMAICIILLLSMWWAVSIIVEEASFTGFVVETSSSPSPVLAYNLSVMMRIYNPTLNEPLLTKPLEAAFFGGQRLHVVRLCDKGNLVFASWSPAR